MSPILHLTVRTQRGNELGNVCDVVWDTETFLILQLKVRKNMLDRHPLLVHVSRIVRVEKDAIVVDDAEVTNAEETMARLDGKRAAATLQRAAKS